MKRQKRNRALSLAVLALGFCGVSPGWAAVTPGGSTTVAADSSQDTTVGKTGTGTLDVDSGSLLSNKYGYIANSVGSSGIATVTGEGSTWSNQAYLYVGYRGSGTLSIEAGAQVTSGQGTLGAVAGSVGTVTVSGDGSKWTNRLRLAIDRGTLAVVDGGMVTTGTLSASMRDIQGNGTIVANGADLDVDLLFDSTHGIVQSLAFGTGGILNLALDGTGDLTVGNRGSNSLKIADGVAVGSYYGSVGAQGNATVTGTGSRWTNSSSLTVAGVLRIQDGGQVSNSLGIVFGEVDLTGGGTKWTNSGSVLLGAPAGATLTIEDGAQVSTSGSLVSNYVGQHSGQAGAVTVRGAGSMWSYVGSSLLYIGKSGIGTLAIEDGGEVSTYHGYLGYDASSSGTATIRGPGSLWTNSRDLYVGNNGSGTLVVADGGKVITKMLYASASNLQGNGTIVANSGYLDADILSNGSDGTTASFGSGGTLRLMLDGTTDLGIGYKSGGTLTVADGGQVAAKTVTVSSQSAVRLHVDGSSMLVVGANGALVNNGVVNLFADALLPAGIYRPIGTLPGKTMTWTGTGSYKAFGGTWSTTAKTFTVLAPTPLSAGESDTVTAGERLLFTDELTGDRVGASFGAITGSVSFSAAPMGAADLAGLAGVLEEGHGVLSAWDFTTNFSGGEAMLSFDIGTGAKELAIWRYSGGVWSEFAPSLFTYDANGIASFTVSSFSGYAVTAAVPEPGMMGLLALAGSMLLARRRR